MVRRIRFSIDEQGEVQLSVEGAQGTSCEDFTEPFEKALGIVSQREFKDSYYAGSVENEATVTDGGAS